jgi:hypothetical protein
MDCQKKVSVSKRFFLQPLMPQLVFWNIIMENGINLSITSKTIT